MMDFVKRYAFRNPILTGMILMLIALAFRLIDIFVLRLDERLGEIILSKALGFGMVLLFVWAIGMTPRAIGFHARRLGASILIAVTITVLPFIIAYAVEWIVMQRSGQAPRLVMSAIDPKAGVAGGWLFALWLVGAMWSTPSWKKACFAA
jgi:hypothetical protein